MLVCEKSFSFLAKYTARWRVDTTESGIVYLHGRETTIETFLNVCEDDVIFDGNCCSSPRMIHVANDIVAWKRELLVLNLLQKHDVEIHGSYKVTKSVQFSCVGDRVDI